MQYDEIFEELNELYAFYKEVDKFKRSWKDLIKSYTANGKTIYLHTNTANPFAYSRLTTFLINYYQMTDLPQILADSTYRNLDTIEIYRGEEKARFARNLVQDEDYHTGGGTFGSGIYTSTTFSYANIYSQYYNKESTGICVKYKLMPNTLMISNQSIKRLQQIIPLYVDGYTSKLEDVDIINKEKFYALLHFLRQKKDRNFTECFMKEISNALAIYLGYDGRCGTSNEFVIFNRSKLCLSQSEYDRILKLAEKEQLDDNSSKIECNDIEENTL